MVRMYISMQGVVHALSNSIRNFAQRSPHVYNAIEKLRAGFACILHDQAHRAVGDVAEEAQKFATGNEIEEHTKTKFSHRHFAHRELCKISNDAHTRQETRDFEGHDRRGFGAVADGGQERGFLRHGGREEVVDHVKRIAREAHRVARAPRIASEVLIKVRAVGMEGLEVGGDGVGVDGGAEVCKCFERDDAGAVGIALKCSRKLRLLSGQCFARLL
jgi:hypothetical protein